MAAGVLDSLLGSLFADLGCVPAAGVEGMTDDPPIGDFGSCAAVGGGVGVVVGVGVELDSKR